MIYNLFLICHTELPNYTPSSVCNTFYRGVSYLSVFIEKTNIVKSGNVRDCDILEPLPNPLLKERELKKTKLSSLLLQEKDRMRVSE
ncbi:hypothetical protein BZG01_19945 [Labilibaculum manganireducens]|uniref:Uncharacterized protein n=1 Tax=Labilibaculum manganireducens TaxID=1940525 RepID=A0A2N3HSN7_9BACT|nr:hypothetical protein BZG01_19945 [Labilibaculum manganireducens]